MKKSSKKIPLSKEQTATAVSGLRKYCKDNFDLELGSLEAEMLLDFISEKIAPYYYNSGLADSIALIKEKTEDLYSFMKDEQ